MIPLAAAHILTLPPALAARAGTDTVLAAEDDLGILETYGSWTATPEGYEVPGRLKCFSMNDYAALETLFAAARKVAPGNDAETIRDADERHTASKSQGRWQVAHSRPAPVRYCGHGRSR